MASNYDASLESPLPKANVVHHARAGPSSEADPNSKAARRRPVSLSRSVGGVLTHWRPDVPAVGANRATACRWPIDCLSEREPGRSYCRHHSRLAYQGSASLKPQGASTIGGFTTRSMAPWLK